MAAGMTKINVGTALNTAYTTAVRTHLAQDTRGVDPRTYLAKARDAMTETVLRFLLVIACPEITLASADPDKIVNS